MCYKSQCICSGPIIFEKISIRNLQNLNALSYPRDIMLRSQYFRGESHEEWLDTWWRPEYLSLSMSMHHQSSSCLTLEACQIVNAWSTGKSPDRKTTPNTKRGRENFNRFTLRFWYKSRTCSWSGTYSDKFNNFSFLYESFQYSQIRIIIARGTKVATHSKFK